MAKTVKQLWKSMTVAEKVDMISAIVAKTKVSFVPPALWNDWSNISLGYKDAIAAYFALKKQDFTPFYSFDY